MLLQKIKDDMKRAIKEQDYDLKYTTRMIIGEVPRLNKKAGIEPTDQEIEDIIKKLIKSEIIVLEYSGQDESLSLYLNILKSYLPQMLTENEIRGWIAMHVTLSDYNPKIKAMGYIMKELKGKADGNIVKKILEGK